MRLCEQHRRQSGHRGRRTRQARPLRECRARHLGLSPMSIDSNAELARSTEQVDFVHTGPGTLAGRYLRRFWQPIYVSAKLAKASAVPIRILGEELALYRGESGQARLIANECAHRLTRLSTG